MFAMRRLDGCVQWRRVGRVGLGWYGLVGAVTLLVAGCSTLGPEAVRQLEGGRSHYEAGRYDKAVAELDRFLASQSSGAGAAEALYIRGQSHVMLGDVYRGRTDLDRALAVSKDAELTARVHVALGSLDWTAERTAGAIEHYRQAVGVLGDRPPKDVVLYRLGVGLMDRGDWAEGRTHLSRLIEAFPRSRLAEPARRRFSWSHEFFTIQVGAYRNLRSAIAQRDVLLRGGLRAKQDKDSRSGQPLWVVHVGQYRTRSQAAAALPRVRRVVSDAMIVP